MATVNGQIHCPVCDRSIKARLVIRATRDASFVAYDGHLLPGNVRNSKRCKAGKILFAGVGFPQWAHKALRKQFPEGE